MPDPTIPLPRSTIALIERSVPVSTRHPGLQLDKFIRPAERQEHQKQSLDEVCRTSGDGPLLQSLQARRQRWLQALSASTWRCTTTGPLTLHLARTSALENAGICLHPIYGFVFLPGTGLKGMARAYAETVWFPSQYAAAANGEPADDQQQRRAAAAWQKIQSTFGWAPHSDDGKSWRPRGIHRHEGNDSAAGSIVFHDAWPEQWPRLQQDIVNNHHTEYYQNEQAAPGDWESPSLVSFLALGPGETFCFALSKRTADVDDELLGLARQWLTAALVYEAAGAKTAAGYGSFRVAEGEAPRLDSPARATWEGTLELVTPAFLAGARQDADDCDLRPATLRGLLRWWWRTMHAGFVDSATLHRLENAVWGDVNTGGAVRLSVMSAGPLQPVRYDAVKDRFHVTPNFQREHGLEDPPNRKTTQGLFYASYGMADGRNLRHFLSPGTRWRIRLAARRSSYGDSKARNGKNRGASLPASMVLEQARLALALLCHFGGAGSKARRGFGSFADLETETGALLQACRNSAQAFRKACGCDAAFRERWAESSNLEQMLPVLEIPVSWADPWFALDQVGFAAQSFAQRYAHEPRKLGLGLPRKIHGPRDRPMDHQTNHRRPQTLRGPKGDRHASPVHYHLARGPDGGLILRVTAFPACHLPNLAESRQFLGELLEHLRGEMEDRSRRRPQSARPSRGGAPGRPAPAAGRPAAAQGLRLPQAGDRVQCVLLAEKTKKGGWKARLVPQGVEGPIVNTGDVPGDKQPDESVTLILHSISAGNQAQFRWPTPADDKPKGNPRRR